jgi:hypothetical protein
MYMPVRRRMCSRRRKRLDFALVVNVLGGFGHISNVQSGKYRGYQARCQQEMQDEGDVIKKHGEVLGALWAGGWRLSLPGQFETCVATTSNVEAA